MQTWTTITKDGWGDGPWLDEPDKAQWVDDASDLDCLIVRNPLMGSLCGYVGVPAGHPCHATDHDDVAVQVHGGLIHSDFCMEGLPESEGVCHVALPGREERIWWLGFDCGHWNDLNPAHDALMRGILGPCYLPYHPIERIYRDLGYVKAEVTDLAAQLAAVAVKRVG